MTRDDLRLQLHRAGFNPVRLNLRWDAFECPTREWIRGEFHRAVVGWARAVGIHRYAVGRVNCRLYADFAKTLAHVCHARTSERDTMLAVGDLEYLRGTEGQHAACVVVYGPGDVGFYDLTAALGGADPLIDLTPEERASCYDLRF